MRFHCFFFFGKNLISSVSFSSRYIQFICLLIIIHLHNFSNILHFFSTILSNIVKSKQIGLQTLRDIIFSSPFINIILSVHCIVFSFLKPCWINFLLFIFFLSCIILEVKDFIAFIFNNSSIS